QIKRLQIIGCNDLLTDLYGAKIDTIFIQDSRCYWLRLSEADITNQVVIRDCVVRGIQSTQETDRISGYRVLRAAIYVDNTSIGSDFVIAASQMSGASSTFSSAIFGLIYAEGAEIGGDFILSQCLISALLTSEQQWETASTSRWDGKFAKAAHGDCIQHPAVALLMRNAEVRGSLQFWRIGSLVQHTEGKSWQAIEGIDGAVDLDFASVGPWVDDGTIWKRMNAATGMPQSEEWKSGEGRLQIQSFTYTTISKNYLSRIRQRKSDGDFYKVLDTDSPPKDGGERNGKMTDPSDTFGLDAGTIRDWLSKQSARRIWGDLLNAQGWTHAARILRMQGQYSDANELQFWRSWFYHKSLNPWRRVEGPRGGGETSRLFSSWIEWLYRYLTLPSGYGYFLLPAIAFTLAVIAGGAGVFQIAFDRGLLIRSQEDGKALEPLSGTIETAPQKKRATPRGGQVSEGPGAPWYNALNETQSLTPASNCGDPLSAPLFSDCDDPRPDQRKPRPEPDVDPPRDEPFCWDGPLFPKKAKPVPPAPQPPTPAQECCEVEVTVKNEISITAKPETAPYPEFNAFAYSFDVFFPVLDFQQGNLWVPGIPPAKEDPVVAAKPLPTVPILFDAVAASEPQLWAAASSAAKFLLSLVVAISVMIVTSVIFVWTIEGRSGFARATFFAAVTFFAGSLLLLLLLDSFSGGFNLEFVWRQFWLQVALGWYFSAIFTAAINRLWEGKD
ncbi:MAG TPA: hypothetical protein DCL54_05785, partial [Alphaproteobacteria bacterium]|nr:hypothetical protein [Alphaproteobacteria bacterium]